MYKMIHAADIIPSTHCTVSVSHSLREVWITLASGITISNVPLTLIWKLLWGKDVKFIRLWLSPSYVPLGIVAMVTNVCSQQLLSILFQQNSWKLNISTKNEAKIHVQATFSGFSPQLHTAPNNQELFLDFWWPLTIVSHCVYCHCWLS